MSILGTNLPVGKIISTLGTSAKFMRPALSGAVAGAGLGLAGSIVSGDGRSGRDVALGALGGVGLSKMGRSYAKAFAKGSVVEKGVYNLGGGVNALKSRYKGDMAGLGFWGRNIVT